VKGAIQTEPIDTADLLKSGNLETGSIVIFEGIVRAEKSSKEISHLFYDAEVEIAEGELNRILDEASSRFTIIDAIAVHRIGIVRPGEISLFVAVSSKHRNEGFQACAFIVDAIKQRLPIWKKDHFADGTEAWH
jgi:molybdopterin synthase catalytic subunit